jgi:uncharacterized protein with PQ loop repeat
MSYLTLSVYFGWIAVVIGFFGFSAQYRRAGTMGVEGISLATWTVFSLMGCFWICYGIVAHSWAISMGSVVVLPQQVSVVFRLAPWRHWRVIVRCLVFFVACCVLPTLVWGWAGGVLGTGIAMAINRAPQLIELIRHDDATGVSVSSWVLGAVCTAFWMLYYVGAHLWAAFSATGCALLANIVIAVLASWRHNQRRAQLVRDEVFVP